MWCPELLNTFQKWSHQRDQIRLSPPSARNTSGLFLLWGLCAAVPCPHFIWASVQSCLPSHNLWSFSSPASFIFLCFILLQSISTTTAPSSTCLLSFFPTFPFHSKVSYATVLLYFKLCASQLSVTVPNTWGSQLKKSEGLFGLKVWEISVTDKLVLLFLHLWWDSTSWQELPLEKAAHFTSSWKPSRKGKGWGPNITSRAHLQWFHFSY